MDTPSCFSAMFMKVKHFYDFLFASLDDSLFKKVKVEVFHNLKVTVDRARGPLYLGHS